MRMEQEGILLEKFPKIFTSHPYIECGDGWFDLIYTLCESIQNYISNKTNIDYNIQLMVIQCRSKLGGLRFYFSGGDDTIRGMIYMAENMSYKICESCGCPGKNYANGWHRTHCDKCELDYQQKKNT